MNRRSLLAGLSVMAAAPALAQTSTITRLTGQVTSANFANFCGLVSDAVDKVIGLKVHIDSPLPDPQDTKLLDEGGAYLFDGEAIELNADKGAIWLHGSIVFDGFYLIKYGGMHQGIMSVGLQQVDEATVILNPAIRVIDQAV